MLKNQSGNNIDGIDSERQSLRIMVCDDSKLVRLTATKMLTPQFDLVLAEDGEDAWEKLVNDPKIQMVFTDLGMPKLDGFGLIDRIRANEDERIRDLPVVVITGAAEDESVKRRIFDVGATDFITKPFKATDLVARTNAHTNYLSANQELQKTTNVDVHTGALNRKGIMRRLDKDNSFTHRHSENFAVALLSLDGFEATYQEIGQKNAESVLKQIVKMLGAELRKEDSIGRISKTEFILSLPMAKSHGAINLTKRICARIDALKIKLGDKEISVTASIGLAAVNKGILSSLDDILNCCHSALDNAKSLGKGQVQFQKIDDDEDQEFEMLSIDTLLEHITRGKPEIVIDNMDSVLKTLEPLVSLMTDDQRTKLMATSKAGA